MPGMLNNMQNLRSARLTQDLSASATTVTVDNAVDFSSLGDFYATIMPPGDISNHTNSEIVLCSWTGGNTLAITRGQRNTNAQAFSTGSILSNAIYVEDLDQVQAVGNTVFETSISGSTYSIASNTELVPALPTEGMRITIRACADASSDPYLDLQGLGAAYPIYSGTYVNKSSQAASSKAVLLQGELYTLVFDSVTGGGCWVATNLVDVSSAIPTVNNATLTIQKNGSNVATFTANASSNVTADITVPTSFSSLSGTVSNSQIAANAVTIGKLADTGWLDCTYASGYTTSSNAGWKKLQARVVAGILYMRGGVSKSSGTFANMTEVQVGTLPSTIKNMISNTSNMNSTGRGGGFVLSAWTVTGASDSHGVGVIMVNPLGGACAWCSTPACFGPLA